MHFKVVRDEKLWKSIRFTMIEAMAIFCFTIAIGIVNALNLLDSDQSQTFGDNTVATEFTRAELLFHLHSGVLGWLSLSSVAIMVWFFVGERDLDEISLRKAKNLLKYVQIVLPVYVVLFYLAFTLANGEEILRLFSIGDGGKGWYFFMVLGALAAIGGFAQAAVFGMKELPKLEVKTPPHYLLIGAMVTSTYGGFFGMILELQNFLAEQFFDSDAGQDGTASHAAAMEAGFLYMMIAAILEWQIIGEKLTEMTTIAKVEIYALFFAGLTVSFGAGFNLIFLATLNLPLMLIGYGVFLYRVASKINPKSIIETTGERFYIPIIACLTYSVIFFLYVVFKVVSGNQDPSELFSSPWIGGLFLANAHGLFVGAMTGVIFVTMIVMFKEADAVGKLAETIGFILMYLGLIGFMLVLIIRGNAQENNDTDLSDLNTHVAALMGIGLYTIMAVLFSRYRKTN